MNFIVKKLLDDIFKNNNISLEKIAENAGLRTFTLRRILSGKRSDALTDVYQKLLQHRKRIEDHAQSIVLEYQEVTYRSDLYLSKKLEILSVNIIEGY